MKEATVTVKLKTIQVRKMPDVTGFLKAMRGLGASDLESTQLQEARK